MVHVFYTRATNGRTMKIKYELVAPNIRRSVFENAKTRTNSSVSRSLSRQFRHIKWSRDASDVITYPLIQETFAFLESNVECEIDRQNFGVGFRSKQIWKRCCKNSVVHYNAIPSLNNWLPLQSFDQRPVGWSLEGLLSSHFLAIAQETFNEKKSGEYWGVTRCGELREAI